MSINNNFPRQQLSFKQKTKAWRKSVLDWADDRTFFKYSPVRNSKLHKKINYDLVNGILYIKDLEQILNPEDIRWKGIPDNIQHFPIINSKMNVLRGEESKRVFDYSVVVTNPNAISEIEEAKKNMILQSLQQAIADSSASEDEYNQNLDKISDYFTYQWQDFREIRANALMNHYSLEYNMPLLFNKGFMDAMTVGEEIYICDIVGGEPTIERVNPLKIDIFMSGYSNRIEDADMIIMEDYWSPGKVIDTYYDVLSRKDMEYIENLPNTVREGSVDSMGNLDERFGFIRTDMAYGSGDSEFYSDLFESSSPADSLLPYDFAGNIRVLRVFWKSRRKIKKIKSYDMNTGEEVFNFYPETYICNKDLGEEEQVFWINEAWEGVKIGSEIYVNMRPRIVQYNRISNPSRCHFGIVGSIYNLNDSSPFSFVDMMKPYNYQYDIIHDRLNKMMARNWGKIIQLDLAKVPKGWDMDKWLYYAKVNGLAVVDSFKEGNIGAATGKLAGALNNASSGTIDADWGNNIQQYINLLEFIKLEMSDVVGISRQREGQISNRETVGGVERATLQSSHITEWLFLLHDDVKKRACECFLETAKIAFKGRSKKFQYILPDNSKQIMEIDGDEFAEADYGLVVSNSEGTQKLKSQIETLAQAALQNQTLSFSTIMKLYNSSSLAEKQRMIENDENRIKEQAQQQQQQQLEAQQQQAQMNQEVAMQKMQQEDTLNQRDNETKILIAQINAQSKENESLNDGIQEPMTEEAAAKLRENIRQFNEKLKLDRDKLSFEKDRHKDDVALKNKALNKTKSTK